MILPLLFLLSIPGIDEIVPFHDPNAPFRPQQRQRPTAHQSPAFGFPNAASGPAAGGVPQFHSQQQQVHHRPQPHQFHQKPQPQQGFYSGNTATNASQDGFYTPQPTHEVRLMPCIRLRMRKCTDIFMLLNSSASNQRRIRRKDSRIQTRASSNSSQTTLRLAATRVSNRLQEVMAASRSHCNSNNLACIHSNIISSSQILSTKFPSTIHCVVALGEPSKCTDCSFYLTETRWLDLR